VRVVVLHSVLELVFGVSLYICEKCRLTFIAK
jgi:hypothetical protein